MKDQWRGNNVDLSKLSDGVKQFFMESRYETSLAPTQNGYKIEAATEKIHNVQLKILVKIFGHPNDFTIEFTADKERKGSLSPSVVLGYVATVFGGGSLLLSEMRLQKALDRLEKMFWDHVDKQVTELTNSAA